MIAPLIAYSTAIVPFFWLTEPNFTVWQFAQPHCIGCDYSKTINAMLVPLPVTELGVHMCEPCPSQKNVEGNLVRASRKGFLLFPHPLKWRGKWEESHFSTLPLPFHLRHQNNCKEVQQSSDFSNNDCFDAFLENSN